MKTFKNILFVILCATSASLCMQFPFDFLHKSESAQTSGLRKIAIGSAAYLPARVYLGDSPLAVTIQALGMLTGAAIATSGFAQIVAQYENEEFKQYFNSPRYDAEIKKLFSDKRFLAGAACGGLGFFLYALHETSQTPDAAKFAALVGLALMGEKIGEHLYALFNK